MAERRGFRPPPPRSGEEPQGEPARQAPLVDPRVARNQVRSGVAQVLAQASNLYSQLSSLAEADLPLPEGARDYLREALRDFAYFHDSVGGLLGELAPSHHDRDLFPEGTQ